MDFTGPPLKVASTDPYTDLLLTACQGDDPRQVKAALDALSKNWPDHSAEPVLRALLPRWRHDSQILEVLLEVYSLVASPQGAPEVFALLDHPDPEVVVAAVSVLDDIGDARLGERALEAALRLTGHLDPEVRSSAVQLIGTIDDWEGGPNTVSPDRLTDVLARLLEHDAPEIRIEAANTFVDWSYEQSRIDGLLARFVYSSDPLLCSPALIRLAASGDPVAFERLLSVLREPDPHPEFVTAASRVGYRNGSRKMKGALRKELKRLRAEKWADRDPENRVNRLRNALSLLKTSWW